jgi:hypothetical protein
MIDRTRLIEPPERFRGQFLDAPEIDFQDVYQFQTSGEPILVTDPIYLVDVYNSKGPDASFLRTHGVFLMDFGGDTSGPVWWQSPFVLIPISMHYCEEPKPEPNVEVVASEIGTDSGSLIFLPLTNTLPKSVRCQIEDVLAAENGAMLHLPAGRWSVFYEQWEPIQDNMTACFRNIVLEWKL